MVRNVGFGRWTASGGSHKTSCYARHSTASILTLSRPPKSGAPRPARRHAPALQAPPSPSVAQLGPTHHAGYCVQLRGPGRGRPPACHSPGALLTAQQSMGGAKVAPCCRVDSGGRPPWCPGEGGPRQQPALGDSAERRWRRIKETKAPRRAGRKPSLQRRRPGQAPSPTADPSRPARSAARNSVINKWQPSSALVHILCRNCRAPCVLRSCRPAAAAWSCAPTTWAAPPTRRVLQAAPVPVLGPLGKARAGARCTSCSFLAASRV